MRPQFSLARLLAAVTCVALALAAWNLYPLERVTGEEPYTGLSSYRIGASWAWDLGMVALSLILCASRRIVAMITVIVSAAALLRLDPSYFERMTSESRDALPVYALFATLFAAFFCAGTVVLIVGLRRKYGLVILLLAVGGVVALSWLRHL